MSQLSKREEVWMQGYMEWNDLKDADALLKAFDERFPVCGKCPENYKFSPEIEALFNNEKSKITVEKEWGINSKRSEELKGIAERVRQWLAETEEKEILKYLANNNIKYLEQLRDVVCSILKDKVIEKTNSQL